MDTPIDIKIKMEKLKKKWPEPPIKFSDQYWRYRADRSLYIYLKDQLASLNRKKDN